MSVCRALRAPWKCTRCRLTAVNSYALGFSGASVAPMAQRTPFPLLANGRQNDNMGWVHQRYLSFAAGRAASESGMLDEILEKEVQEHVATVAQDDTEPWYLQVQDDESAPETTLLERQRLPEIPTDCPERLNEIVRYLSEGIGTELITLLDLRSLDPPPALGGNLIMLICTARSIRHLNVSADRLCRWLRTNYKLRANADGLLGRRELKLKLRRKARRAKILGSKAQPAEGDDGITTGWICVNIGSIEPTLSRDRKLQSDSGEIVGFGEEEAGIHVVVQMLTDEKRESLQLEELWESFMNRQAKKELARSGETKDTLSASAEESQLHGESTWAPASHHLKRSHPSDPSISSFPSLIQRRSLFTSTQPSSARPFSHRSILDMNGVNPDKNGSIGLSDSSSPSNENSGHEMWNLLQHLQSLSLSEVQLALGEGWQDRVSTSFLISFYKEMSSQPTVNEYRAWLALMQYGKQIEHPGYSIGGMLHVIKQMQAHGSQVPKDVFDKVLQHVTISGEEFTLSDEKSSPTAFHLVYTVLSILDDMPRGQSIHSQDAIDKLFHAVIIMKDTNPSAVAKHLHPQVIAWLARLAHMHRCRVPSREIYLEAIDELAGAHRWADLWDIWAGFPIREEARSPELYITLFRCLAREKHRRVCTETLSRVVPVMKHENPPVPVEGDVAATLMEVLKVADPLVEKQWLDGGHSHRPIVRLYQQCTNGLKDQDWWEEDQYTL